MDRRDKPVESSQLAVGASLGPRFIARLIDSVLIGVASVYAIWMAGLAVGFTANAVSVAIVIGYFTLMESYTGRTIGKMVLRLETVGPDGRNPSLEMAFRRNIWYLLGILPYVGGLAEVAAAVSIAVTVSRSPVHVGWHDIFASGTRVLPVRR